MIKGFLYCEIRCAGRVWWYKLKIIRAAVGNRKYHIIYACWYICYISWIGSIKLPSSFYRPFFAILSIVLQQLIPISTQGWYELYKSEIPFWEGSTWFILERSKHGISHKHTLRWCIHGIATTADIPAASGTLARGGASWLKTIYKQGPYSKNRNS